MSDDGTGGSDPLTSDERGKEQNDGSEDEGRDYSSSYDESPGPGGGKRSRGEEEEESLDDDDDDDDDVTERDEWERDQEDITDDSSKGEPYINEEERRPSSDGGGLGHTERERGGEEEEEGEEGEEEEEEEEGEEEIQAQDFGQSEKDQEYIADDPETSQVYTATETTLLSREKHTPARAHALTLEWCFGVNGALPVFYLQAGDQLVIMYASSHVGVIYNHTSTSQHLLQGHSNSISCLCVSEDRRWIVTADRGHQSLVIIWDSYSGIPVQTLFDCHPEDGVVSMALSKDAKHLVTLGAEEVQCVCIWDWTSEKDTPLCVTKLSPEYSSQKYIIFNPHDSTELVSNNDSQVLFYTLTKESLEYIAPELHDKTFDMVVGSFSQSVFHLDGLQALTATAAGNLVLWDTTITSTTRKAIKLIPLQKDAITVLTLTDSCIVTGDILGHIKFFDEKYRLLFWYSEFGLDAIASVSFSKLWSPRCSQGYNNNDCTLEAKPFLIRNFVVSTMGSAVAHVNTQCGAAQTLLYEHCEPLHAVACHPKQTIVAMGSHSGNLKMWDYSSKRVICSRALKMEKKIQCMTFDPQGLYLAVGFASGAVRILDACTLQSDPEKRFHCTYDCISEITFSLDSMYLATADVGKAVTVFYMQTENELQHWKCLGRHISHYEPIRSILFGVHLDSNRARLLSLGMDRRLVEYDLDNSKENQLLLLSSERIEQSAVPSYMTWYPPLTTERFLLTASDQYKMKLFNTTTKMCRKTLLGPTYGSPVEKMIVLPVFKEKGTSSYYLAYITKDMVGVQILPLDGNPYKSNALICHPVRVSDLACSYDGRFVFTSGGSDCTVFSWELSISAAEAAATLGGKDLIPFYSLLDGGREGAFYREMEDFFFYCQLRYQGIDSMEERHLSTRIILTDVPFVMRALGFFPTEQEVEDMLNEVKFSKYAETGKYVIDIDLVEFIKLYINHRPAFGISREELVQSFQVLGESDARGQPELQRQQMMELLQGRGERMTEDEVVDCFTTLLGLDSGMGILEHGPDKHGEYSLDAAIPDVITMETFASHILDFPSCQKKSEKSSPTE